MRRSCLQACLTEEEWEVSQQILEIHRSLRKMTTMIQLENTPMMSAILDAVLKTRTYLVAVRTESSVFFSCLR